MQSALTANEKEKANQRLFIQTTSKQHQQQQLQTVRKVPKPVLINNGYISERCSALATQLGAHYTIKRHDKRNVSGNKTNRHTINKKNQQQRIYHQIKLCKLKNKIEILNRKYANNVTTNNRSSYFFTILNQKCKRRKRKQTNKYKQEMKQESLAAEAAMFRYMYVYGLMYVVTTEL